MKKNAISLATFIFIGVSISYFLFAQSLNRSAYPNREASGGLSKLEAFFYYQPLIVFPGQAIRFYDASSGNPESWLWSFGDGKTSIEKNPSHVYEISNIYHVNLRVQKGDLISVNNRNVLVRSSANLNSSGLIADFIFEPESPQAGVAVRFYDKSTGNPTSRLWQFGYFDFSLLKDPIKTFLSNRRFKVTLSVRNEFGSDKCIKYIDIGPPPDYIIIAKSCSLKDVQAAIAQANPGDTVIVPAGSAVWSSNLVIAKGIILKGAGIDRTIITCKFDGSGSNWGSSRFLVSYVPESANADQPFRLSGFTFNLNNKDTGGLLLRNTTNYHQTKIRIDHTKWENVIGNFTRHIIHVYGYFYGVADNNYYDTPGLMRFEALDTTTWANETFNFGTADNFYMEDNFFRLHKGDYFYIEAAGRLALRYNEIHCDVTDDYFPVIDVHGNQANAWSAAMGFEGYSNQIYASYSMRVIDMRAGRVLFYNNTTTQSNGSSNIAAREEEYDSNNPPAHAPDGQPQHVSNSYIFNNYRNGSLQITDFPYIGSQLYYEDEGCYVPTEDIHFFKHNTSFDGSSGVGIGPLSQRPSSCSKEGVAWWATDENKLYRWKNGKWELYYTPFPYPHPLRTILSD